MHWKGRIWGYLIPEIRTMDVVIQETVGQRRTSRMEAWDTPTSKGQAENKKPTEETEGRVGKWGRVERAVPLTSKQERTSGRSVN